MLTILHYLSNCARQLNGSLHFIASLSCIFFYLRRNPWRTISANAPRFSQRSVLVNNLRNDFFHSDHMLYITQTADHVLYTQTDDINDIWVHCYKLFIGMIDRHTPLKKKVVRGITVSWITQNYSGYKHKKSSS